jgi:hypothetical protein
MLDREKLIELAKGAKERLESHAKKLESDDELKKTLRRFARELRQVKIKRA